MERRRRKTGRPLTGKQIAMWFGLCLALGVYSGWLIWEALNGNSTNRMSISPISVPKHAGQDADVGTPRISHREYEKIHAFRLHLDSLSAAGGSGPDSIMAHRPGLRDSLRTAEEVYQRQQGHYSIEK